MDLIPHTPLPTPSSVPSPSPSSIDEAKRLESLSKVEIVREFLALKVIISSSILLVVIVP